MWETQGAVRRVGVIAAVVGVLSVGAAPSLPSAVARGIVEETEVCFAVHNLGDPVAVAVRGTLFHTSEFTASSTALLLQHGAVAERSAWDGGQPEIHGVPSIARLLAAAGYGVFAIDRLGYAASPYERPPGSGWSLTAPGYIEMAHEIVTQIRDGTFRLGDDSCSDGDPPAHGAANVVLSGFSSGGALTMGYAVRYHDIAGIIPMGWSTHPVASAALSELVTDVLVPQWAQGRDYVEFFTDGADGYSEFCERFLFHVPGATANALRQYCGFDYYAETRWPTPSGESSVAPMNAAVRAGVGAVGPTRVLLVFGDHDVVFPGPNRQPGDPDTVSSEYDLWKSRCNCDVSLYLQPDAGHANFAHRSVPHLVDEIVAWLQGHGL